MRGWTEMKCLLPLSTILPISDTYVEPTAPAARAPAATAPTRITPRPFAGPCTAPRGTKGTIGRPRPDPHPLFSDPDRPPGGQCTGPSTRPPPPPPPPRRTCPTLSLTTRRTWRRRTRTARACPTGSRRSTPTTSTPRYPTAYSSKTSTPLEHEVAQNSYREKIYNNNDHLLYNLV